MHIEIENTNIDKNDFPNKNDSNARWYVATQNALFFRDGQKYPDKFVINLVFTSTKSDQDSVQPIKPGKYNLAENAFYLNQRNQMQLDCSRLVQAA